jgi:flagellar hook-associated protein 2
MDYIRAKTQVDVKTYTRGALAGDTTYSNVGNQITSILLGQVGGLNAGEPTRLSDIGITIGDDLHATLSDASALTDKLTADPQSVSNLFNSTNGVATRIASLLKPYTDTYGIIYNQTQAISDQMSQIDDRIKMLTERNTLKENYYRTQFTALQDLLNETTLQQSALSSLTTSVNKILGLA